MEKLTVPVRANRAIYQLKAAVDRIEPPIWRRLHVWEDTTLPPLHQILQAVFGWWDYHLHEFVIGRRIFSKPDEEDAWFERKVSDERGVRLSKVVQRVGTGFSYKYDFGDSWKIVILLEAILLPEDEVMYPRCVAGARNGPPEDVGGTGGYEKYVEAMSDPEHERYAEMLDWRGPFDPEAFDLAAVNDELRKRFKRRRSVAAPQSGGPPAAAEVQPDPKLAAAAKALAPQFLSIPHGLRPPPERKRVRPEEKLPIELTDRERKLILDESFAEEDLTARLRVLPKPGERPFYYYTLDEFDGLSGYVAAEANHAKIKSFRRTGTGYSRRSALFSTPIRTRTIDSALRIPGG